MAPDPRKFESPTASRQGRFHRFFAEWIVPNVALYGTLFFAIGVYFVMARRFCHWAWRLPISAAVVGGLVVLHRRLSKENARFLRCDLAIAGWMIGTFLFFGFAGDDRLVRRFSSEDWKADTDIDAGVSRSFMADHLIKNVLKRGMNRSEVELLLGPDVDPLGGPTRRNAAAPVCYWYIGRGFLDDEYVRLEFGADDRLTDWGISEF